MKLPRPNQPPLKSAPGHDRIVPIETHDQRGPDPGRILGLDLGTKTIGLALSDPGRTIAGSLGVIRRQGLSRDLARLAEVIAQHQVAAIVLGLPLHLDERESDGSRRSRNFARELERAFGLPVALVDESLSTAEAEDILVAADLSRKKRQRVIDGLAAAIILQAHLNELAEVKVSPGRPRPPT
jgi:putative holliday junction resolvase